MTTKNRRIRVEYKGNLKVPLQPITLELISKTLEKYIRKKHLSKTVFIMQPPKGFCVRVIFGLIMLKKKFFKFSNIDHCSVAVFDPKALVIVDRINDQLRITLIRFEKLIELTEVHKEIQDAIGNADLTNSDMRYSLSNHEEDQYDSAVNVEIEVKSNAEYDVYADAHDESFVPEDVTVEVESEDEQYFYQPEEVIDIAQITPQITDVEMSFEPIQKLRQSDRTKRQIQSQMSLPNFPSFFDFDIEKHKIFCRTAKMDNISHSNLDCLCSDSSDNNEMSDVPRTLEPGSAYMYSKHHTLSVPCIFGQCESDDEVF